LDGIKLSVEVPVATGQTEESLKAIAIFLSAVLILLAVDGAWWWHLGRPARALDAAAAMVRLSDQDTACEVLRHGNNHGQRMPCSTVPQYLRETLKLAPGASIGIAVLGHVMDSPVNAMSAELIRSGYQVPGVIHVGFVTEPGPKP
jgi:hypothetical protein